MSEREAALCEAADYFDSMGSVWGGDSNWLTTGTHVAGLVSGLLREMAEEPA